MDAEWLFVQAFEDLERCMHDPSAYSALRCAAVLRQMFADQHTLLAQAKKGYDIKPIFSVLHPRHVDFAKLGLPPPSMAVMGVQLDGTPKPLERTNLGLDSFVKYTVAEFDGQRLSVRDVIKYLSDACGGVHLGPPKDNEQKVLAELERSFPLHTMDPEGRAQRVRPTLTTIRGIAKVALDGLRPLYEAILTKNDPSRRRLTAMGTARTLELRFPGQAGALHANLVTPPMPVGPFLTAPPTAFYSFTENAPPVDDFAKIAKALGYGTHKPFGVPTLDDIPTDLVDGFRSIPAVVPGAVLPRAIAWRRDPGRPDTVLFKLTHDGNPVLAVWWDAEGSILRFRFRTLEASLDCSWANGLYATAYFRWEPGRISLTYATSLESSGYEQRTVVSN